MSIEAEKSVLGSILIDQRAAAIACATVSVEDFAIEIHRDIFRRILRLRDDHQPIDAITLVDAFETAKTLSHVGGFTYITDLTVFTISAANVEQHIAILHRARERRELVAANIEIAQAVENGDDNALETAEKLIFDISQRRIGSQIERIGTRAHEALSAYLSDSATNHDHHLKWWS